MGNRIRILLLCAASLGAQTYDIVLKGGHIIDPANNIDAIGDVAISAGKIAKVGGTISDPAKKTIDVKGRYVTPGLVDLHFHSFGYSGSIFPDDTALLTGTTTVVDAGGPGYRTINEFRKQIVATSATRVLALINIAGNGMTGRASEDNVADMLSDKTADAIKANRDIVVGIKVARKFCKKRYMTRKTRATASSSVFTTSVIEARTKGVVSKGILASSPRGNDGSSCFTCASTPRATCSALALVASEIATPEAGLPL